MCNFARPSIVVIKRFFFFSMTGEIRRQLDLSDAGFIVTVPKLLSHVQEAVAGTNVVMISSRLPLE